MMYHYHQGRIWISPWWVVRVQQRGLRSYSPELGRWINRDPIGEWGGTSLVCSVENQPTAIIDPSGLSPKHDHEHCENQRKDYEERLKDSTSSISKFWADLIEGLPEGKECPVPPVTCKCCPKGYGGWYDGGSSKGQIVICENNLSKKKGWTDYGNRIRHELVHAAQDCYGFDTSSCVNSVCKEIQAYSQDGAHPTVASILNGVHFSSFCACAKEALPDWDPKVTSCEKLRESADAAKAKLVIQQTFFAIKEKCLSKKASDPGGLPETIPVPPAAPTP